MLIKNIEDAKSDYVVVAISNYESHDSKMIKLTDKHSKLTGG